MIYLYLVLVESYKALNKTDGIAETYTFPRKIEWSSLTLNAAILDKKKKSIEIFIFALLCGASKGRDTTKKSENKNLSWFLFQYNFLKCTRREGLSTLSILISKMSKESVSYCNKVLIRNSIRYSVRYFTFSCNCLVLLIKMIQWIKVNACVHNLLANNLPNLAQFSISIPPVSVRKGLVFWRV